MLCKLIDTHAHLDELRNLDSMLEAAAEAGVIATVAVGSSYRSNVETLKISQEHRHFVYPALGLHPWELANLGPSDIDDNLRFIEQNIAAVVAVGEIGLDYDKRVLKVATKELQQEVLDRLLNIARRYGKPAIIHSRYAWKDALSLVQDAEIEKAVFHWFTGFSSVLKDIIAGGQSREGVVALGVCHDGGKEIAAAVREIDRHIGQNRFATVPHAIAVSVNECRA